MNERTHGNWDANARRQRVQGAALNLGVRADLAGLHGENDQPRTERASGFALRSASARSNASHSSLVKPSIAISPSLGNGQARRNASRGTTTIRPVGSARVGTAHTAATVRRTLGELTAIHHPGQATTTSPRRTQSAARTVGTALSV